MALNKRWRRNPFDANTVNSVLITEEEHIIEFHEEPNAYGFYANEGILFDANDPVVLVQDNTAQTAFTEIPRTIAPSSGQYRVDYDEDGYYNTGFVQCNSSDNGKTVLFTYRGTGTLVHPTFRTLTDYNYAGNVNVEGNATIAGSVVLADDTGGTISVSGKRVEDVANPTAATDAVNRQSVLSLLGANVGFELLTSSGNWVCPENVTQVIYGAIGGGGGGAAANGVNQGGPGGGGGGAIYGVQSVTPGASYAYTIGAAGAGGVVGVSSGNGANGGDTTIFSRTASGGARGDSGTGTGGAGGNGDVAGAKGGNRDAGSLNTPGTGGGAPGALGGAAIAGAPSNNSLGGQGGGLLGGRGGRTGDGVSIGAGGAGGNYGAGGGGGVYDGVSTSYAGGAGAPGCILLIY